MRCLENIHAIYEKSLVQLGCVFPDASAVCFSLVVCYVCARRSEFDVFAVRVGRFLASVEHVAPHIGAEVSSCL